MTYVAIATWGYGDDRGFSIVYAGAFYQSAYHMLKNFKFPDEWQNFGYIETWSAGKLQQTNEVIS